MQTNICCSLKTAICVASDLLSFIFSGSHKTMNGIARSWSLSEKNQTDTNRRALRKRKIFGYLVQIMDLSNIAASCISQNSQTISCIYKRNEFTLKAIKKTQKRKENFFFVKRFCIFLTFVKFTQLTHSILTAKQFFPVLKKIVLYFSMFKT